MSPTFSLMSIHPAYAEQIFQGTKTIELRRQRPRFERGDVVLVYVTSPERAVRGAFVVDAVLSLPVAEMWRRHHGVLGVDRVTYDRYFGGVEFAHGVVVRRAASWGGANLSELRRRFEDFRPPQSYMRWPERWVLPPEWKITA